MNKKTQKGLVAALAATMGAGIVAPGVQAATVDPVAAAQQAVAKVEKERTKKSIDEARALVAKIQDAKVKKDLTIKINKVMLDKYNKATAAVVKAKASKAQADVTAAYKLVTDLTNDDLTRKNALTGALNKVQKELYTQVDTLLAKADIKQADLNGARAIIKDMLNPWKAPREKTYNVLQGKKMTEARVAASKAVETKTQADADIAKALYADIATVTNNNSVKNWIEKVLKPIVDSIKVDETAKVESVSANNLKTVVVKFNQELSADTLGTIQVKDANGNLVTLEATQGIKLSADKKAVVLTASGLFAQGSEYTLKVEGAKSAAGKEVAKYEGKFTTLDTTVPVVEGATITSPKTIEIQFSEAVTSSLLSGGYANFAGVLTNLVQIDGVNAYVDGISIDYATNKVSLRLNTALTAAEHTIKVAGFVDHAGFPVVTKEFKSTLAADTAAPTVVAATVVAYDTVRVTFDKVIATPANGNFSVTVAGTPSNTITAVTPVAGDAKSYDLTLNAPLGLGAVVDAVLKYKDVKDFYNNTVTTEKTFSFKAIDETTAPTATAAVNADNTVTVTFSENVEGLTTSDFELLDKDSKVVSGGVVNVVGKTINNVTSKKVYTVTLASSVDEGGNYTLKLKKDSANDFSIRKNTNAETSFAFSTSDAVAPHTSAVVQVLESGSTTINSDTDVLDTKVTIFFDEAMDKATLENPANYLINNAPIGSNVSLTAAVDGKSVVLVVNKTAGSGVTQANFATGGNATLKVLNLKDLAGNLVSEFNTNLVINNFATTSSFVSDVQLVAKNQIKIIPSANNSITSVNLNNIQVIDGNSTTVYAQATRVVSYNSDGSVTVELSRELSSDGMAKEALAGTGSAAIVAGDSLRIKIVGDGVKNVQGQTVAYNTDLNLDGDVSTITNDSFVDATITDKVKASYVADYGTDNDGLIEVNDTNNTITLTFDENVYANASDLKAALVIKNKDGVRLGTSAYTVTVDTDAIDAPGGTANAKTVVITLATPATADYVGNYTIALSDNVVLKDIAGNNANNIATVTTEDLTVESQDSLDLAAINTALASITTLGFDSTKNATHATPQINAPAAANGITYTFTAKGADGANGGVLTIGTAGAFVDVTRGTGSDVITLTLTATKGTQSVTKVFNVTITTGTNAVTVAAH